MIATPPRPPDVLIIEDSDVIALLVERVLHAEGYATIRARDGAAGLARLSQLPLPRMVTLDIVLPLVSGFNVLAEIRRREETRHLPVLMLTSSAREQDVVRAVAGGATEFIAKPFEAAQLSARVRRLLGPA